MTAVGRRRIWRVSGWATMLAGAALLVALALAAVGGADKATLAGEAAVGLLLVFTGLIIVLALVVFIVVLCLLVRSAH